MSSFSFFFVHPSIGVRHASSWPYAKNDMGLTIVSWNLVLHATGSWSISLIQFLSQIWLHSALDLQHVSSRLQPVKDCSVGNTLINPEAMSKDISDFIFLISSAINHFHLWNHMFVKLKGEIYFWYKVYNAIPFVLRQRQYSIIVPLT